MQIVVVAQLLTCVQLCATHDLQHVRSPCLSPSPGAYSNSCPLSWWCHPTISSCHPLLFLPSFFPSIRVFSDELVLRIRWPKYWSVSFSISPSNEFSGLISFKIDWFDLLAVQGTLKSLLQDHNSKASVLQHSAFFMVQLSHLYITAGKTSFDYIDLCWGSDVFALFCTSPTLLLKLAGCFYRTSWWRQDKITLLMDSECL